MNLLKYSKPACTLVLRMKIPKSDSENDNDDTFSTAGRLKENIPSCLFCKPVLLKRIKLCELNRQHSFGRKEGRNLSIISKSRNLLKKDFVSRSARFAVGKSKLKKY